MEIDTGAADCLAAVGTVDEPILDVQLPLELAEASGGHAPLDRLGAVALDGRPDDVHPPPGGARTPSMGERTTTPCGTSSRTRSVNLRRSSLSSETLTGLIRPAGNRLLTEIFHGR